jgi:hypothetical protein
MDAEANCRTCVSANCEACTDRETCTECKDDAALLDEGCACVHSYYDVATDSCVACDDSCRSCNGTTSLNCTACKDGFRL